MFFFFLGGFWLLLCSFILLGSFLVDYLLFVGVVLVVFDILLVVVRCFVLYEERWVVVDNRDMRSGICCFYFYYVCREDLFIRYWWGVKGFVWLCLCVKVFCWFMFVCNFLRILWVVVIVLYNYFFICEFRWIYSCKSMNNIIRWYNYDVVVWCGW